VRVSGFVDPPARAAFKRAIEEVERASQAEIVVSVRRQSAPTPHAYLLAGVLGAIAAHAYMLYAEHEFSTDALFIDPIVAGVIVGLLSMLALPWRRWTTPASRRRDTVRAAARAAFLDRGVTRTRARSGVLVYVSVVERMAELVPDDGVAAAVDRETWDAARATIERAIPGGAVAVADAVRALGPVLAKAMPPRDDDENELPDELDGDAA